MTGEHSEKVDFCFSWTESKKFSKIIRLQVQPKLTQTNILGNIEKLVKYN